MPKPLTVLLLGSCIPLLLFFRSPNDGTSSTTAVHPVGRVDEIRFSSAHFSIVGNLYLPDVGSLRYPAVIWVSGSGPSYRTVRQKETQRILHSFLDRGFACFLIDKPGSGDSKGEVNEDSLFAQLASIAVDAAKTLSRHPEVDRERIGLYGSSQAGYIMPKAIAQYPGFAFLIGSSCPGENSIEQWDYLLEKQMVCEGMSPEKARTNARMFAVLRETIVKQEFDEALAYFDRHPMIVPSIGYDSSFSRTARGWWPRSVDPNDESHFDPVSLVPQIRIPIFFAYGEHDTQIDPHQAIAAYKDAFSRSGHKQAEIILLPNSDHNMKVSGGCLRDIRTAGEGGEYRYDPEYLRTLSGWLDALNQSGRAH